jgi:hypothetical protein
MTLKIGRFCATAPDLLILINTHVFFTSPSPLYRLCTQAKKIINKAIEWELLFTNEWQAGWQMFKNSALGGDGGVTIAINYPGRIAIYVEGVGLLAALHSQWLCGTTLSCPMTWMLSAAGG